MGDAARRIQINAHNLKLFAYGETSQRKVRRTVRLGPPERTRTPSLEAVRGNYQSDPSESPPTVLDRTAQEYRSAWSLSRDREDTYWLRYRYVV